MDLLGEELMDLGEVIEVRLVENRLKPLEVITPKKIRQSDFLRDDNLLIFLFHFPLMLDKLPCVSSISCSHFGFSASAVF